MPSNDCQYFSDAWFESTDHTRAVRVQILQSFEKKIKYFLGIGELVFADRDYEDERCLLPEEVPAEDRALHVEIRARHESVNKRFKQFAALTSSYRHGLDTHRYVFHAIENLTDLMLEDTDPLLQIDLQ